MTEPTPKAPKAKPTTSETLNATLQALLVAAIRYAEDAPTHVHETTVGDYRLRFTAGEISSITRR